jgi:hypothetical protein
LKEKKEREGSSTRKDKRQVEIGARSLSLPLAGAQDSSGALPVLSPVQVSSFLSVLSLSPLGLRFWDGFLRLCIEFDWERRPHPPCALWAFQFLLNSILRVLVFGLNFNSAMNSFVARDRSSS